MIFYNPLDLKNIWENMPYHISGQLMLLKKWYVGFDPHTDYLLTRITPYKYANFDALSAILELNNFRTIIRLDPFHTERKWMTLTRLCYSGKKIIILDENMCDKKYNVWFDDFPIGCGACGELVHEFDSCSDRVAIPPKPKITLIKPSSKNQPTGASAANSPSIIGWIRVSASSENKTKPHLNPQGHKPYLTENGGITITYESEETSNEIVLIVVANLNNNTTQGRLDNNSQEANQPPKTPDIKHPIVENQQVDLLNCIPNHDPNRDGFDDEGEDVKVEFDPSEDDFESYEEQLECYIEPYLEEPILEYPETTTFELPPLF
ncbi:hypothetical protein V2J09_011143 [Rumex salicifolius]